jgi:D-arabinose 1-dehydrogenase-like Zn-dependent alcohol dehydrogenase
MKAVVFDRFAAPLRVEAVPEPTCPDDGAVIAVRATGICRSDWHGWQGHDPEIARLPHVPGHEFAGEVLEVGSQVRRIRPGDRVTIPFVAGCGECPECVAGAPQVCPDQYQPGFTGWGSFAEAVAVRYADFNLARLPAEMDYVQAASFGCRVGTAYRAVIQLGRAEPGQWVAIHGCGGLGLAAVMMAALRQTRVVAVDIQPGALQMAAAFGAHTTLDASQTPDIPAAIHELTQGGADLSLDTLGSAVTATNSIHCLRRRGRHIQVGLLVGREAAKPLPIDRVVAHELQLSGSHGFAAADYPALWELAALHPGAFGKLVTRQIHLPQVPAALAEMGLHAHRGVTVIVPENSGF